MHRTVASSLHHQTIGWWIALGGLLLIAFATLRPEATPSEAAGLCIICGPNGGVDAILNILLFIPLGIGLALAQVRGSRAIVALVILSALVEASQFAAIPGRDASIGDLLTNSIGGAVGFAVARYRSAWLRPSPRIALGLALGWSALWLIVQTGSSFAFVPSPPATRYYGQLAREFSNLATFRGEIASATIGSDTVPDVPLADSRRVRALLLGGATVAAVVVPAEPTPRIAPILRIADAEQEEIVLLAQRDRDLVFGVRTGAAVLKLRPPQYAMANVFPRHGDTLSAGTSRAMSLAAHFGPSAVGLRVQAEGLVRERQTPLTSPLGWALILPFQWYLKGSRSELLITGAWIALFIIPLAYWGSWILAPDRSNPSKASVAAVVVPILAVMTLGLVIIPRWFGLSGASSVQWLSASLGLIAGLAASRVAASRGSPHEVK